MTRYCTFTVLVLCVCNVSCQDAPVVNTPMGSLRGYYMKTREGREISAFTAIPFAQEPVGELRFKAPVPVEPWQGVRDATQDTPGCVQRNPYIRQGEIGGQEDCLYLNIYTPYTSNEDIQNNKKLPVMVFIHGGGWMCGDSSTDTYGPEYLLDHEIILVTTNYRLGPLGFLSTQDEHCPGNNGLKDQREALRFIQKTIESFGGDKDSVTIFGESAGGASVHYHMLSRSSSGLFQKAISESGTALVPWAEAPPGEAKVNAFKLAKFLDCPQAPSDAMIECLRTKDSYDIIDTEYRFYLWDYEPMTPFKAAVEPDLPGAFLTQPPRDLHDVPAAVPWMTGLTKDEGCLKSVWITTNETRLKEFTSGFETIAPVTFYYDNTPRDHVITKKIKQKYLKPDLESGILKAYTDSYFAYPAVEAVEQTLSYTESPIYLYKLTYRATNSFSQIFGDPVGNHGVCHADDLMHLFPIHFLNKPKSAKDEEMGKLMRTMWTNFAKSGDPNGPVNISVKWEPTTGEKKMKYLEIASEQSMKYDFAERSRFWDEMPLWHNIQPSHYDIQHHDEL